MWLYSISAVVRLGWCMIILFFPLSGSLSFPFRLQQLTRLFTSSVRSVIPFPSTVIGTDGNMGIGPPSSNHPCKWLDNENGNGRDLLLTSLLANGTTTTTSTSTVRYLSSHTRNRQYTYANDKYMYVDNFDSDDKSLASRMFSPESLQRWWTRHTAGHRGLLIFLIPSLLSQVSLLQAAVPFCLDRLSQYLSPMYIGVSLLLLRKTGPALVQTALCTSIFVGGCFMLADTYNAGSSWLPLKATNDSYAMVTGASGGLGMELARLLYKDGFSLVLVARDIGSLQDLKESLETEATMATMMEGQQGRLGPRTDSSSSTERDDSREGEDRDENQSSGGDEDSSPISDIISLNTDNSKARISDNVIETSGAIGSTVATKQQLQVSATTVLPSSSSLRRRQSHRRRSSSSEFDRRVNHAPQHPSASNPSTPTSPDTGALDAPQSSIQQRPPSPPRQEIVLIPADLSSSTAPHLVLQQLKQRGVADKIDVLVNNAGCGSRGAFIGSSIEALLDAVDLNVRATVLLTRLLAPRIAKRGSGGRILIMGSLSSVAPGPSVAVYSATKAFVASFAASLRRELLGEGVFVTLALPGATRETNFAAAAGVEDALVFRGPGLSMSASATAQHIYHGLVQGRDVVVPGIVNKVYVYGLTRLLPPAAVGALSQLAWAPAPSWLPFLRPLPKTIKERQQLLLQRRRREQQQAAPWTSMMKPWRWPKSLSLLLPSVIDKLRQQQKPASDGAKPWSQHKDKGSSQDVEAEDGSGVDDEAAVERDEGPTSDEGRQSPKAWDGSEPPQQPQQPQTPQEQTTDPVPSAPVPPDSSDDTGSTTPPTSTPNAPSQKVKQQPTGKDQDQSLGGGDGVIELRPPGDKGHGQRSGTGQVVILGGFPKRVWSLWRRLFRGKGPSGDKKRDENAVSAKPGKSITSSMQKRSSLPARDSAAAAGSAGPSSSMSAMDAWRRGAAGSSSAAPDQPKPKPKSFPAKPRTGTTTSRPNMAATLRERIRGWAEQFWYRPVIDYAALRRFAIKPFQRKGGHIVIEEDAITTDRSDTPADSTAHSSPPQAKPSTPANTKIPGAAAKNKTSAASGGTGKGTRHMSTGGEQDLYSDDMTTAAATKIQQSSSPSYSKESDYNHDNESKALWGDLSPSPSLSEPCSLRALSVCLCALAAEGQEPPPELGSGPAQWSPLLSCELDGDGHGEDDRDLLATHDSDDYSYDFDSNISSMGSSGSVGRELANLLQGLGSAVNSSDSSDLEERLVKEQVISEGQDPGRRQRVVFVHDVPVYL